MKRRVVPIVIAVVLAIAAGAIVYFFAQGADKRAVADEQPIDVLVAVSLIPQGTALQDAQSQGLVQTTQVPVRLRPPGSLDAVTAQNGPLVATADIAAGQVLFASAFGSEVPAAPTEALQVPEGMVAISISLGDPQKVGSFLRPGSKIAVFETISIPGQTAQDVPTQVTRLLLDQIEILAIGATTAALVPTATPDVYSAALVTVAVDQLQAEKLIQATQSGQPYLALLGENTTLKQTAGVGAADLFN
jgi:pilus assembly protein CpaB